MRGQAIERNTDAIVRNMKQVSSDVKDMTGNVKDATSNWKDESKAQIDFLHKTLPVVVQKGGEIADAAKEEVAALKGATDATKELLISAKTVIDQVADKDNGIQPILVESRDVIANLNGYLKDDAIKTAVPQIVNNLAQSSGHLASASNHIDHMADTTSQLEDHFAKPFLNPEKNPFKRIWSQTSPFAVAGAKVVTSVF